MSVTPSVNEELPVSAVAVQYRAVKQGKYDIGFQFALDASAPAADYYRVMDTITAVCEREDLKAKRVEKFDALRVARQQPIDCQRDLERLKVDRAAYVAARRAMHDRSGRRMEFKLSEKQQADLDKFDEQIRQTETAIKQFMRDVPIIEYELACIDARLEGLPEPTRPRELDDAIDALKSAA